MFSWRILQIIICNENIAVALQHDLFFIKFVSVFHGSRLMLAKKFCHELALFVHDISSRSFSLTDNLLVEEPGSQLRRIQRVKFKPHLWTCFKSNGLKLSQSCRRTRDKILGTFKRFALGYIKNRFNVINFVTTLAYPVGFKIH